jgi:predicted dehydrogenase
VIKLGIIGSGFGQYGHFPAFLQTPNCEIVAHCGESRPQLEEYFASIGFTNRYTDWRKMLAEVELDALAIAVTPQAQVEICRVACPPKSYTFLPRSHSL